MRYAKHIAKKLIASILYYSGLLHAYSYFKLKDKAVVLMYHRVLPDNKNTISFTHDSIIVHTDTFKKHMAFLKKNFNLLDINTFSNHIINNISFKDKSCLITFDDGWSDNYKHAFPILKKMDVSALIFLPTDYIGTGQMFWPERLSFLLFNACKNYNANKSILDSIGLNLQQVEHDEDIKSVISNYVRNLKGKPYATINSVIESLESHLSHNKSMPDNNTVDSFINWNQAAEMLNNKVFFGSHTLSHRILTIINTSEVDTEVSQSKNIIESKLAAKIKSFAYPNGNYNNEVRERVINSGYDISFSTETGAVSCNDDPYTIHRMNIDELSTHSIPLFFCRILNII